MRWLLDTNVVSESAKEDGNENVRRWLASRPPSRCYLSAITFAEIRRGVERTPSGHRRRALESWFAQDLMSEFAERLVPIDGPVAFEWGRLMARLERIGRPINAMDGLLAATALRHGLVIVTRNVDDFAHAAVNCIDPWRPLTR